jgi:hypothetical protein
VDIFFDIKLILKVRRIRFRLGFKGGQENDDEWGLRKTDGGGGGFPMNFLLIDDYAPAPLAQGLPEAWQGFSVRYKDCQEDVYTYMFVCKHKVRNFDTHE